MNPKNDKVGRAEAESIAVSMLVWMTGREELMGRFLALTGITAASIRDAAGDPGFLAGIADFVMAHEPTLMDFCADSGFKPETVAAAHNALHGGEANPWL